MAMSASPDPPPTTTRTVLKPLAGTFTLSDLPPPGEPVGVTVMSYWMFGPRGVVFGMIFLAVLYFVVWERLRRLSRTGLVPMLALFALLARSAGIEEIHTIYAVSVPVILLVYVIIFDWLQKLLMPGLSVRPVPSARP